MKEHRIVIGRVYGSEFYDENFKPSLEVDVEISLKLEKNPTTLSISGSVWNARKTDIIQGGQCQDTLRDLYKRHKFKNWNVDPTKFVKLLDIWDRWHLNDMNAGCEHQRALGWGKNELTLENYELSSETLHQQHEIKRKVEADIATSGKAEITPEEQTILNLPWRVETPETNETLKKHYTFKGYEKKYSGWVYENQHHEGVLCKPCPTCGYKYGTAWKTEPLPQDVIDFVQGFIKNPR